MPNGETTAIGKPTARLWAVALYCLIGLFAFFLASFPARNSEVAVHLASGKAMLAGDFSGGNLPLNVGIHPGWAYDLFSYWLYEALGGGALVLVKAAAIGLLAVLLMTMARVRGLWIPAALTALTLLTMGTRLLLQPATFAYVLFALIVFVLWRRDDLRAMSPAVFVSHWPLLLLFVIWANVSGGWLVGLAVVACYGL